jgi:hypothetical protein
VPFSDNLQIVTRLAWMAQRFDTWNSSIRWNSAAYREEEKQSEKSKDVHAQVSQSKSLN